MDIFSTLTGTLEPKDTRAVLKVNGKVYNTWKSISIGRSLGQIAGSFSFTTANRFAGDNSQWGFTDGDECTVEIAGTRIITGYIDDIDDGYGLGNHDINITGRDKTGDLVDCPFDIFSEGVSEFNNQTPIQLIKKLCKPFGINVEIDRALIADAGLNTQIAKETIEIGEPVYEHIARICQQYGALPITTGYGDLFLTRSGTKRANDILEVGVNIKANRLKQSGKDRYSTYYTFTNGGNPTTAFNTKLNPDGKLDDEYVKRNRPLIIMMGAQGANKDTCQKRAAWEARIRAGASRKVESLVRGWTQTNDDIWPLNGLVDVKDNKIGVEAEMLIASINLNLDSTGGEVNTLALVHPDTFILKERVPVPNKKLTAFDDVRSKSNLFDTTLPSGL